MDFTYRTPLLDMFRRGEVPDDVRMLAARGALAPRAHEQLALLALLTEDEDEGISMAANETIGRIPREALATFLGRPDIGDDIREFFRARGVEPAATTQATSEAAEAPLVETAEPEPQVEAIPLKPDPTQAMEPVRAANPVQAVNRAQEKSDPPSGGLNGPSADDDKEATAQRLSKLTVAEKVKCAMLGSREERFILIRDVNRLVAAAVLSSPKVNDADIEAFAKMANVSEEVLRTIGNSRGWMKRYTVAASLALNPKTPIAVSLGVVGRLVERDLKAIMRDRNMQEPLRAAARRLLANADARKT